MRMRWLVLALLAGLLMGAAGCGKREREADFIFASGSDLKTFDPQKMSWLSNIRIAECLWEPLVRFELPALEVVSAAAASWDLSDDGRTYTFHLRPEARWSNGDPVTAQDFAYAWRRAFSPDFAADYAGLFFVVDGAEDYFTFRRALLARWAFQKTGADPEFEESDQAVRAAYTALGEGEIDDLEAAGDAYFAEHVGIQTPDERTLVVRLKHPTPHFLELCAFTTFMPNHRPSFQAAVVSDPDTGYQRLPDALWTPGQLVSNGPYRLARYRVGRDLLLEQNPHFWNRAAMGNTRILQRVIDNPQTALLAYEQGEVDWLPDIPTSIPLAAELAATGRADVHLHPWAGTYFYSFNCRPTLPDGRANPLADPRVRRALSMAVDRRVLVQQVTRLNQPVARSFIPPAMIEGYEPPVGAGVSFDPAAARALLAEAGYGTPDHPEGRPLEGLSLLFNTAGGHEGIAQTIAQQWQQHLGLRVPLDSMEYKVFGDRLKSQKYTIARASWIGDYRDPVTFLAKYHSQDGNNDSKWSNPRYDELLALAEAAPTRSERFALLREAETILLEEAPIAPLFHYLTLDLFDPQRVQGLHLNPWNFRRLELVKVTKQ